MMAAASNKIRKRIRVYGRVQGVGFRFLAGCAARSLGLTGWVQNLDDGSVLMELQGTAEAMDMLIAEVNDSKYVVIEDIRSRIIPLDPDERSFRTRSTGWGDDDYD